LNENDSPSQKDYNVTYRHNRIDKKAKGESRLKQIKINNRSHTKSLSAIMTFVSKD